MKNYPHRENHSDRNFNLKPSRSNMSRSPPYTEQDKRHSKNREMMTDSEIEDEKFIKWGMREQMKMLPHLYKK